MEKSDEIIMSEVRNGNVAEMSALFERHHIRLYNFFRHLGLRKETCQDLTQNVFYRMMRYSKTYKDGKSFKAWMYSIARNLYHDHIDEQKTERSLISLSGDYNPEVCDIHPEFAEEEYQLLERSLKELPDNQKELIILCRYQGLKYHEASQILDMSVPALKTGMFRAIKNLQTIFLKKL